MHFLILVGILRPSSFFLFSFSWRRFFVAIAFVLQKRDYLGFSAKKTRKTGHYLNTNDVSFTNFFGALQKHMEIS